MKVNTVCALCTVRPSAAAVVHGQLQHARPHGIWLHLVSITGPVSCWKNCSHNKPTLYTQVCIHKSIATGAMSTQRPLWDFGMQLPGIHMHILLYIQYCNIYTAAHTSHTALSFSVTITHFSGRQTAEQQIQRCNGLILIVPRDQYRATLISYSQRKSPHLWMLLCHNPLLIFYSPASHSKLNSSGPKVFFTLGSIWMPFPPRCYLLSGFDVSLYGHSVRPLLISREVLTTANLRCPEPGNFIPLVCKAHERPHIHTPLPGFQRPQLITLQDLGLSIQSSSIQFINYIPSL